MKSFICFCCVLALFSLSASAATAPQNLKVEYQAALDQASALRAAGAEIPLALKERIVRLEDELGVNRGRATLDQGGDVCSTATVIPSLPYCDTGTTVGYADDYVCTLPAGGGGPGPDVVYAYTPLITEIVSVSLCGSSYDTYLHVWAGCPAAGMTPICCNDDFCGGSSCCPGLILFGGITYYIVVDGAFATSAGDYVIAVTPGDTCGTCEEPEPCVADTHAVIDCCHGPTLLHGSTIGAGNDCPARPSEDQIWEIQIVSPCHYSFNGCVNAPNGDPCAWDSYLYLTTQCCGGDVIACGDDGCEHANGIGCFGQSTLLSPGCYEGDSCFFLAPGTYYLHVEGFFPTSAGEYVITVDCCCDYPFPDEGWDHGDLPMCNYPTLIGNPAHQLSLIAWLGPLIDPEPGPQILNLDQLPEDDGVFYVGLPWTPCEPATVSVTVTGGPFYPTYAQECCGCLFLNGWKDGNLDGDFCDTLCITSSGIFADEWIVQDALVTPGVWAFTFIDPGVFDLGIYEGRFRWRLTSQPVGRNGFGGPATVCPTTCMGTYPFDFLGEVEDYIIADAQLAVELTGFDAVAGDGQVSLGWTTASETDNDHFEIERDGALLVRVPTQGNGASGHHYEYTDRDLTNGATYTYKLVSADVNGLRADLATTSATPRAAAATVTEYALHQNYPNPFNARTRIAFDLVEEGLVNLRIYNLQGQEVATVVNGTMARGSHTVAFDAGSLPSGMYWYRLEVNGFAAEKKMLLMK